MKDRLVPLVAILAVGVVFLAYLPSGPVEYVYDDVRFVARNPAVTEGVSFPRYFLDPSTQAAGESHGGIYRPLRTLSFRAVAILHDSALAQRLANLLLHALNGFLLYLLLVSLFPSLSRMAIFLGALGFLLHPLASEAVAFISSRGDLLALTGMLLALLFLQRSGRRSFLAAGILFLLALFAKESAAVLPLLVVGVDLYRGGWSVVRERAGLYLSLGLVLVAFLGLRLAVLTGDQFGQAGGMGLEPLERGTSLFVAGLYDLFVLLFPVRLTFELRIATAVAAPGLAVAGFFALAALVTVAVLARRRAPPVTLAVAWIFIALLPVTALQLVFPLKILTANRFLYPALPALAIVLGFAASRSAAGRVLALAVVLAFFPLTVLRAAAFESSEALWEDVIETDPENPVALFGLGELALKRGDLATARHRLTESARVDPRHPQVFAYLGEVMEALAEEAPSGSAVQNDLLDYAFNAYHRAVRTWQGGVTEERRLYRYTLVNAAWFAAIRGRGDLAGEHLGEFLDAEGYVPVHGRAGSLLLARLRYLAEQVERTDPEFGRRLFDAANALADGMTTGRSK